MIQKKTLDKVEEFIKKNKVVNHSTVQRNTKLHSYSLDKALKILEDEGKITVEKLVLEGNTQSIIVKWREKK